MATSISKSPAERYLKFLLSRPDCPDNKGLVREVVTLRVPFISYDYLDSLRRRLKVPSPYFPWDAKHKSSMAFLKREGIVGLHHPDVFTKGAITIFHNANLREVAEAMLITRATHPLIAEVLHKTQGFQCSPNSVARFAHYFWDVASMDRTSIRALLKCEVDQVKLIDDPFIKAQFSALDRTRYEDARTIAADLPSSAAAARIVQMKLGIKPRYAEELEVLQEVKSNCLAQVQRFSMACGSHDYEKGLGYMMIAEKAHAMALASNKPEEVLRKAVSELKNKVDTTRIPSINELSGGEHSSDYENLREPPSKESN